MSLVPVWVQATDGKFYKNPVFFGDGWYLCFDDDDPPEIVVEHIKGSVPSVARKHAVDCLEEAGIVGKILKVRTSVCGRMFPPQFTPVRQARSFDVELRGPTPIPPIHDGCVNGMVVGECVLHAWSLKFPTNIIAELFRTNGRVNTRLAGWVDNHPHYLMDDNKRRQFVRNKIVKAFPAARGLDPDLFIKTFGEEMEIPKSS